VHDKCKRDVFFCDSVGFWSNRREIGKHELLTQTPVRAYILSKVFQEPRSDQGKSYWGDDNSNTDVNSTIQYQCRIAGCKSVFENKQGFEPVETCRWVAAEAARDNCMSSHKEQDALKKSILFRAEYHAFFSLVAWRPESVKLPPSARMEAAFAIVRKWRAEASEDKIIGGFCFWMTSPVAL